MAKKIIAISILFLSSCGGTTGPTNYVESSFKYCYELDWCDDKCHSLIKDDNEYYEKELNDCLWTRCSDSSGEWKCWHLPSAGVVSDFE